MRIAILMGGKSREREVSLKSGRAVTEALLRKGSEAIPVDAADDVAAKLKEIDPELVFIALHGRYGEDGAIQGLLEVMGLPYTGSGVACSAVCMDKVLTKKLLMYEGIPTAPFMVIDKDAYFKNSKAVQAQIINELGLPVVIKPATQGSSIGTSIVREEEARWCRCRSPVDERSRLAEKFIVE